MAMKCLIFCYTLVIILVLVKSSTKQCVFEGTKRDEALCGIHVANCTFYSIPDIRSTITYIDLWGQPLKQLPNNAFKVLRSQRNITTVRLQFCQIAHIDVDAFMNLQSLELVDLSFNSISQVDVGTFQNVPKIKYIFLEHNYITVLSTGLLANLTSLIRVHLDYNRIVHIEENAFQNTPELHYIDLSHNKLQTLNMSFKDKLDNKTFLYLHDNPWTCNNDLIEIHDYFLKRNKTYKNNVKYIPICEGPLEISGRKWNETSLAIDKHHYSNSPQKLIDNREEPPKVSLIALLVGEVSRISFISLHLIFIGMLLYLYKIRGIIFEMVATRSHGGSNRE